jgi:hypothetical protein
MHLRKFLFFFLASAAFGAASANTCVVEDAAIPKSEAERAASEVKRYTKQFFLRDSRDRPVAHFPYRIVLDTGCVVRGVTDTQGRTLKVSSGEAASSVRLEHDVPDHAASNTQGLYRNQTTTSLETDDR